ncbi:MAG: response regulator transcription factor [Candidatus Kapabacteria bacterium]|nr:response regulator transcription factor [Candidatus Kapabacteria bacterium]
MKNVKVLIVDDHILFTQMTHSFLAEQTWVNLIKIVNNGKDFMDYIMSETNFDLVLIDLQMPNFDGLVTMKESLKVNPNLKFIVVSQYDNPLKINRAIEIGAKGYVCKNENTEILCKVMQDVLAGNISLSSNAQKGLAKLNNPVDGKEYISKRELEVLELILEGKSKEEISSDLFISISTIETHRKNIHKKLKVRNLAELIKTAKSMGWG